MAPVYRRSRPPSIQTENLVYENEHVISKKRSVMPRWQTVLLFLLVSAVIALAAHHAVNVPFLLRRNKLSWMIQTQVAPGIMLKLGLSRSNDKTVAMMGPHKAELIFRQEAANCQSPQTWLRLVGDALLSVPMSLVDTSTWAGTFSVPINGTYSVQVQWTCNDSADSMQSFTVPTSLKMIGNSSVSSEIQKSKSSNHFFQEGMWISSEKFKTGVVDQPYIWHDPQTAPTDATLIKALSSLGESLVSKEATVIPEKFQELSNYELVCWLGSQSAATIREAFLSLRPLLFPSQRPFKFHYYNVTNFQKPDQHWDDETKKRFRKCKTIFVSLDKLDEAPMTQEEYKRQVQTFLGHIVTAINDETFPIWMITVNAPPMTASRMCTSSAMTSTTHHACNDALFSLWKENTFPPRVKLLDTTDLVDPQFGSHLKDVFAVIAMRIYAIVGEQVEEWRKANQIGKVNGLVRNGKVEPNPTLVPYDWTEMK